MAIDPSLTETTLFDEVLKYGLFLGAIFQIVCIAAVIFVPSKDDRRVSQPFVFITLNIFHTIFVIYYAKNSTVCIIQLYSVTQKVNSKPQERIPVCRIWIMNDRII